MELNEFACIDYDKVCKEGDENKADTVCFAMGDCSKITIVIVEKKKGEIGLTLHPIQQLNKTAERLHETVKRANINIVKILVAKNFSQREFTESLSKKEKIMPVSYERVRKKSSLGIYEKIAKYVYENK